MGMNLGNSKIIYNSLTENNYIKIGETELRFMGDIKYVDKILNKGEDRMPEITQRIRLRWSVLLKSSMSIICLYV